MEFTTGHRIVRLAAHSGRAFPSRRASGDQGDVSTEDGAVVVFETDLGAIGSLVVSQVTPGRKNRLWFSFDGPNASYSFDQEVPEELRIGTRAQNVVVLRGTGEFGKAASRYSRLPAGHPQGYQDAFNAYISDVYASVDGDAPDGLPTFADGLRAAVVTQAVLDSVASRTWVEVPP
jgi:predicted dehydrogenase